MQMHVYVICVCPIKELGVFSLSSTNPRAGRYLGRYVNLWMVPQGLRLPPSLHMCFISDLRTTGRAGAH